MEAPSHPQPLHVLQITDCHLFPTADAKLRGVATRDSLAAVLAAACAERAPDAVLATGDIAQQPSAETYRLFLDTLREHVDAPLLCVPGNHDHGAIFAAELPTAELRLGDWRLVGIDTHVDDVVGGSVASSELARVAALPPGRTLVAGHHCPLAIDCAWLDAHRIDNGAALLDALVAAGVDAYVFGHIHQPFAHRHLHAGGELAIYGTPSTCFQFAVRTPSFAIDGDANPGYRWLTLGPDGIETAVHRADYALAIEHPPTRRGAKP